MSKNGIAYHVIGGGTFAPLRSHLALCAPAFGTAAKNMALYFAEKEIPCALHLTRMAETTSNIITNDHLADFLDVLLDAPATKAIIMSAAVCDFVGQIGSVKSGWSAERIESREGALAIDVIPAEKLLNRIYEQRPDICGVGFKTTTGKTISEQFAAAQRQIASSKVTFVLANDLHTRMNLLIPADGESEKDILIASPERSACLRKLVDAVIDNVGQRAKPVPGPRYG